MPSTVWDVLKKRYAVTGEIRTVRWGETPKTRGTGLYVVSLSADPRSLQGCLPAAPIDHSALDDWLTRCPELHLDGKRPTAEQLAAKLQRFWFSDEVVLYMGLTADSLRRRITAYYKTALGAAGPHAGGYFLKTLSCLEQLHVHYAVGDGTAVEERRALLAFSEGLSDESRSRLRGPRDGLPFANICWAAGGKKVHGLTGTRSRKGKSVTTKPQTKKPTLHAEMARILEPVDGAWYPCEALAKDVNEAKRYRKKDGSAASPWQVWARARNYPELFEVAAGMVRLVD
ncbi:MAG: hypothetical protein HZA61_13680 [Candidatus Eisenbacteria bacterium]|uniref:Uncharacterized protein n=1 Tax=Eiseniibacteriota bacterium TaxID=2212470 RepID=A0A933W414_UNCEI|nr:hypothetical protein [Candidatus Eisenbacteria bacterium]